jgi:hypothetical protein
MATHDIVMGAAGAAGADVAYIDDMFSTYLFPSTSGTDNTIVNGIDLATEGGMVWIKSRTRSSTNNYVLDTVRGSSSGNTKALVTNTTAAQSTGANLDYLTFNNNGFTAKAVSGGGELGTNTYYGDFASWTFRKQPKFFDVVTYTGNSSGGSSQTVPHNLGSVPGCIIVKATSIAGENWAVWHRSFTTNQVIYLDLTNAVATTSTGNSFPVLPTATDFTVGFNGSQNGNGTTYVAYLFAHDAGGFGTAGTDNVISCGTYAGTGSAVSVNLGYEPQWILIRKIDGSTAGRNWTIYDSMRGIPTGGTDAMLRANTSDEEITAVNNVDLTATGFIANSNIAEASVNYIYIAIRRPMKPPTTGTEVFSPVVFTAPDALTTAGFAVDTAIEYQNIDTSNLQYFSSRLTGTQTLNSRSTAAQTTEAALWDSNTQVRLSDQGNSYKRLYHMFRRAPGFFDVVCYTGTGSATNITHNLGVAPEIVIVKSRSLSASDWRVNLYNVLGSTTGAILQSSGAAFSDTTAWNSTYPTATTFRVGGINDVNGSGSTYVAYLFASVAGVSKVGTYTGTGTTNAINCGFSGGARFVLIKRTDDTGDWYVWDTARGIVSGNDPYLLMNSTAAEVTNTDYIDPSSAGFEISSSAPAAINASGGTFIYLAIA